MGYKMDVVFKAVVIGITGTILALIIKKTNPEISAGLALCVCTVIAVLAVRLFSQVKEVALLADFGQSFSSAYIAPVFKCVGIGICARLGADICKDSGQTSVASSVELCGAVCALYVSLPLIKTLLRMIGEFT